MRRSKIIKLGASLAVAIATLFPAGVLATSGTIQPISCSVVADSSSNSANQPGSKFLVSGDLVTGKILVSGNPGCQVAVTITSWTAPNGKDGKPYSLQRLFSHTTEMFGTGKHTISTQLPDCFFQVDLLRGDNPTGANGSALYTDSALMGWLFGGTTTCTHPSPSPTPSPSPSGTASPSPSPSSTPVVLGASTQPPSQLPDTGAALGSLVGVGSMIGAGYAYVRSRRPFRPKA